MSNERRTGRGLVAAGVALARSRGAQLGLAVIFALAVLPACGRHPTGPNVILISLDTLRADHLGLYGYPLETSPNIERLAARGTVFESAYSQAPNTAPSHTTLLTSVYPSVHRVWSHGMVADSSLPVLPELFAQAGYRTAAFVQLEVGETYRRGFESYERGRRWSNDLERPRDIVAWLGEHADEPFFLFVHTYETHAPYRPPDEFRRRFDQPYEGPLRHDLIRTVDLDRFNSGEITLTEADLRHVVALYDAEIAFIDDRMGRLFDAVERLGLAESTLIVLMSDHGEEFGERGQVGRHSYTIYNELMRVPLVIAGPGVAAGHRVEAPVGLIDVAPTLLALAGLDVPRIFQGVDLSPLWRGEPGRRPYVIVERPDQQAIIRGSFKLHSDGRLFDLAADSGETDDVAAGHPAEAAVLRDRLDRWQAEVARLQRRVAAPGGVDLSPQERERLEALGYLR